MIYEETYNYLLRNVSSTEFDVCLLSLLHMDWDGNIRLDVNELAGKAGTTKKYLKEIFKKFTSFAKARFVLVPVEGKDGLLYRFNIGKTNLQYNEKVDKYCKKYRFFYTDEFRNLPINAKRLLLMGAFRMSTMQTTEVVINVSDIVPSAQQAGETMPFTKSRLVEAIQAVQNSELRHVVSVSLASNRFAKKEVVVFSFAPNTLQDFLENYTERALLRKNLFEAGYSEFISDAYCLELEKMGKYIYRSLLKKEKELANAEGVQVCAKDELQKLARYVYATAIERLVPALLSKKAELDSPKKLSAYFSAIMYAVVAEEMAKYSHQATTIQSLLENESLHQRVSSDIHGEEAGFVLVYEELKPIRLKHQFFVHLSKTLQAWCEEWVIARVKRITEECEALVEETQKGSEETQKSKIEELLGRMQAVKKTAFEQLDTIKEWLNVNGNRAVKKEKRIDFIVKIKQSISSYLGTHQDRLQHKIENFNVVS